MIAMEDSFRKASHEKNSSFNELCAVFVILSVLVAFVFCQALHFQFVNFDDDSYVYGNAVVQKGLTVDGVSFAFTHKQASNWHPLTTLSHMADCEFYGLDAGGHHLTNLILHGMTAVLLLLALREMSFPFWPAAFVVAVFAIHPLRAESVAWVSERKDVLSGFFFMLTLLAYVRYSRAPWSFGNYLAVIISFGLGLLSKPMLVTMPLVLCLLDYWPLRRFPAANPQEATGYRRIIGEKIPLLVMSFAVSIVTLWVQDQALQAAQAIPLSLRFSNALVSCVAYIGEFFHPVNLAAFYPYPADGYSPQEIGLAIFILAASTIAAFHWRKRFPYLLVGWLWYLVMLLPVIGLVQVGAQARADRYTYLPGIGLCLAFTWTIMDLTSRWRHRESVLAVSAAAIILALAVTARTQTAYWHDSETLWRHAIACTSNNAVAESNLANDLERQGRLDEAIAHAETAIKIKPDYPDALNCLGYALLQKGQMTDAVYCLQQALKIKPDYGAAHNNLGMAFLQAGQLDQAIEHYQAAVKFQPDLADAYNGLGACLVQKGEFTQAITNYEMAISLRSDYVEAESNFAWILATANDGRLRNGERAVQLAEHANQLSRSSNILVLRTLAAAYAEIGRYPEAIQAAQTAVGLATASGNAEWVRILQAEVGLYQSGQPFRQNGQVP